MIKKNWASLTALIAVLTVTGCAPTATEETWTTPQLGSSIPSFTSADSLPFDAYHRSEADFTAMQRAEAELLVTCAADYGVDARYSGDFIRPDDISRSMWGGRPGTLDEEHASEFGYHASDTSPWAPIGGFYLKDPSNIQPALTSTGDDLVTLVTYGPTEESELDVPLDSHGEPVPAGGCLGIVEKTIGGSLTSDVEIASDLVNLALAHADVADSIARWSKCMTASGYDYDTVQGPAEAFSLTLITPEEVAVAVADVRCTETSRWADTFYAVLGDYQQQAVDRHPADFEAVLASETARLTALTASG